MDAAAVPRGNGIRRSLAWWSRRLRFIDCDATLRLHRLASIQGRADRFDFRPKVKVSELKGVAKKRQTSRRGPFQNAWSAQQSALQPMTAIVVAKGMCCRDHDEPAAGAKFGTLGWV
jgi:hypothetical protein